MEKTKINKQAEDQAGLMSLFFSLVSVILYFSFKEGFSVNASIAIFFSTLLTYLSGYPLFIRGTENRWTSNKRQWKFSHWLIFGVSTSILLCIVFQLVEFIFQMIRFRY
jgi:hypothetical protein